MSAKCPKRKPAKRNPVARAVRKLRSHIVPDRRRKKRARAEKREVGEMIDKEK